MRYILGLVLTGSEKKSNFSSPKGARDSPGSRNLKTCQGDPGSTFTPNRHLSLQPFTQAGTQSLVPPPPLFESPLLPSRPRVGLARIARRSPTNSSTHHPNLPPSICLGYPPPPPLTLNSLVQPCPSPSSPRPLLPRSTCLRTTLPLPPRLLLSSDPSHYSNSRAPCHLANPRLRLLPPP